MRRPQGAIVNAEPCLLTWTFSPTPLYRLAVHRIRLQSWHASAAVHSSETLATLLENSMALQHLQHPVSTLDSDNVRNSSGRVSMNSRAKPLSKPYTQASGYHQVSSEKTM